jgi:hypothetical protein
LTGPPAIPIFTSVSTVREIEAALPHLSALELRHVLRAADQFLREKCGPAIYDDTYGIVTDADLIPAGDEAFLAYDRAEAAAHESKAR